MTIASHCVELLRAHGPMTAADLGASCRFAKVTKARDPALSVSGALSWHTDGRAIRLGDRYHLVTSVLEGRWLTFPAPLEPLAFQSADLTVLRGPATREGVPISGGGTLRCRSWGTWRIVGHELAHADVIGLRLREGAAELSAVTLDGSAQERGHILVERLQGTISPFALRSDRSARPQALLRLLHEDDALLREPTPPLSHLLPDPPAAPWPTAPIASPPGHRRLALDLPGWLYDELDDCAASDGEGLGAWVTAELARMARWPALRPPSDDYLYPLRDDYLGTDPLHPTDLDGQLREGKDAVWRPRDRDLGARDADEVDLRVVPFPQESAQTPAADPGRRPTG